MTHQAITLIPGVNTTETAAMNQAGITTSQLIRFVPDTSGPLVQKLGGWLKFYAGQMVATVRALVAWEDTGAVTHLGVGVQSPAAGTGQLAVITAGTLADVTPQFVTDNVAPNFTTTSGSAVVTVVDSTVSPVSNYDSVFIATPVAVGGIVLFGMYQITYPGTPTQYTITATDVLGNPALATSNVSNGGTLSIFTTTNGSTTVSVALANHGYIVGSTFPVLISTTVGGITFLGNYIVESVTDANNFIIFGANPATSSTSGTENGGNVNNTYFIGYGVLTTGSGYGVGGYGLGGYGTGTTNVPVQGAQIVASDWVLDNWGEVLLACPTPTSPTLSPVYFYDPLAGVPVAQVITPGPPVNEGFFVAMPQRQIVCYGSTFTGIKDPLLVRWCDVNNYSIWIGQVTNQAGSYRLSKGSRIVGGIQGPQQGLLWTDIDLWAMQYIGQPFIYGFNEIAQGCGLIAKKAVGVLNGVVYWMGASQFFVYAGGAVQVLPSTVWDYIFQQLDTTRLNLIRCGVNSKFNEVAWYFPVAGSVDASAYVKYNTALGVWDYGTLTRTAWIDQSVLGAPIAAGLDTRTGLPYLYQHDTVNVATGLLATDDDIYPMSSSFTTGYAAIAEGYSKMFVDQLWPDFKWAYLGQGSGSPQSSATVQFSMSYTDYPNQTAQSTPTYSLTSASQFISPRFRGRLVSASVASSDSGSFWRIGRVRYRGAADGRF